MGVLRTIATLLLSSVLVAIAGGLAVGSETWASKSSPLRITYNGSTLGHGYGSFEARKTSSSTVAVISDDVKNGMSVYITSEVSGREKRSSNTPHGISVVLDHTYKSTNVATAAIRMGEDAPLRPDILSKYYYVSDNA